jgi:hypothetical protein
MFDWSIYRLFVLNTGWKHFPPNDDIRKCLLDIKHCWTKNAFWDVNNKKWRKWCKFNSPFLFNNICGLPLLAMDTKCPNQVFCVWLVVLETIYAKYWLETWFPPNDDIPKFFLVMKNGSTKNACWGVNNMELRKWWKFVSTFFFNNTYALPVLTMNTNVQII